MERNLHNHEENSKSVETIDSARFSRSRPNAFEQLAPLREAKNRAPVWNIRPAGESVFAILSLDAGPREITFVLILPVID
jgi:hypothetical protein